VGGDEGELAGRVEHHGESAQPDLPAEHVGRKLREKRDRKGTAAQDLTAGLTGLPALAEDEVLDAVEIAADEEKLGWLVVLDRGYIQTSGQGVVQIQGRGQGRRDAGMVVERDVRDRIARARRRN